MFKTSAIWVNNGFKGDFNSAVQKEIKAECLPVNEPKIPKATILIVRLGINSVSRFPSPWHERSEAL